LDNYAVIRKAKLVPEEMITLDSTGKKITAITNPFGGGVVLGPVDKAKDVVNQAFIIYLEHLPQEACIELATHDWTNAGAYIIDLVASYYEKVPVDLSIATEVCEDDENELSFIFDVDVNSEYWQEQLQYDYAHGGY